MKKTSRSSERSAVVTQKDIARMAGVSSTVVSYVINEGPRPVAEATKQRVLRTIAESGYRPNKHAQRLKTRTDQARKQLGIIVGGGSEMLKRPYYGDILAGIYEEAYRQGQHIRFLHFFEELHDPLLCNEHIHPGEISALILFPLFVAFQRPENEALLQRICSRIHNIVCLEKSVADLPAVTFDRVDAARVAVTHLIALGHRRIGFVGNQGDRIQGYRQALLEHYLAYDERLVIHPGLKNSAEEGYAGTRALLQRDPRPTAIFAICDEVALGVMGALADQHLTIPEDVAVVSIDDMDFAAMVRPALTTVQIPRRQMGVHALRMLAMHDAYPDTHPASTVLRTELIVRQSCGAITRHG